MEQARLYELQYQIAHRHKDGSWAEMQEIQHSSPSSHDAERSWGIKRIFRCKTCDEYATIQPGADGEPIQPR